MYENKSFAFTPLSAYLCGSILSASVSDTGHRRRNVYYADTYAVSCAFNIGSMRSVSRLPMDSSHYLCSIIFAKRMDLL